MNRRQTIVRSQHDKSTEFFVCSRLTAQDESLSWEARGVLMYLLSKPSDWKVQVDDLKQNCGRDKVYKILDELIKARYITREDVIGEKNKRLGVIYTVYERPVDREKPLTEIPYAETPHAETPHTEKADVYKIENDKVEKKDSAAIADALTVAKPKVSAPVQSKSLDEFNAKIAADKVVGRIKPNKPAPSSKKKTIPAAEINPMKDAIVTAFGWDWKTMTKSEGGLVNRAAWELCDAGRKPEHVKVIYDWCKRQGWAGFKPTALPGAASDALKGLRPSTEPVYGSQPIDYAKELPPEADDWSATRWLRPTQESA